MWVRANPSGSGDGKSTAPRHTSLSVSTSDDSHSTQLYPLPSSTEESSPLSRQQQATRTAPGSPDIVSSAVRQSQQQPGKKSPPGPFLVLFRTMPGGGQLERLLRRPWAQFALAQVGVVVAVVAVLAVLHDYAVRMQPVQRVKSALHQQSLIETLSQKLRDRCPITGPVCRIPSTADFALAHPNLHSSHHPNHNRRRMQDMGEDSGYDNRRSRGSDRGDSSSSSSNSRSSSYGVGGDSGSSSKNKLPLLVFFAGVEGSGHKFFEQVFRHLPVNFSVVAFEPDLHLYAEPTQTHVHGQDVRCPLLPYARPLSAFAKELLKRLREVGEGPYLRARDSYPLGRVRTPLARPDLFQLLQLDGLLYRLKVVVLQRALADAVRSAYRMGYHGGDIGLQVRIVEDEMTFLDSTIRLIPCGQYITLDFDWIADDPSLVAAPLAEFLDIGITADDIIAAVEGAKQTKPSHAVEYPSFGGQGVEEFFALRTDLWPLLAASRLTPYFWPHTPRDWPAEDVAAALQVAERRRGYDFD